MQTSLRLTILYDSPRYGFAFYVYRVEMLQPRELACVSRRE